jgi:flagellar hook-associated protein 1 FlgK
MDLGLSIATTGLNAAMAEIDVTTENLANATAPGYVSESVQLASLPGTGGVGDGVEVTSIAQATSAMLSANNSQAQASLSSVSALQQVLTGIQNVFPLGQTQASSSNSSGNSSLSGQLSSFWSSWDAVAQDPSSLAPRTTIVNDAKGMAQTLNEASSQLDQLASNSSQELQTNLTQANTLLAQAASLNQSIIQSGSGTSSSNSGTNQLTDQLNNVLGQLTSLTGANVSMQTNGTANLSIGGISVLQGNAAATLSTTPPVGTAASTTTSVYAYPQGASAGSIEGVAAPISGGAVAGLLTGLNQYIPEYQTQLNGVATSLATTVNNQLAQGYTASGVSGSTEPLFTSTGAMSAGTISVSSAIEADPSLIAAGGATQTVTGSSVAGGSVSSAETLSFTKSGATTTYSTTAGESLAAIASGLNAQFANSGSGLSASLNSAGTQLTVSDATVSSTAFTVTSSAAGAGTTGLGGPTAGTAVNSAVGPVGANDASNSQAMAELGTVSTGPDLAYQNLIEGIGSDTQNANSQLTAQTSVADQAQQALQSVTGVNTDAQLTALMNFQASYQASAKVVSVIDATMQSLLTAV